MIESDEPVDPEAVIEEEQGAVAKEPWSADPEESFAVEEANPSSSFSVNQGKPQCIPILSQDIIYLYHQSKTYICA